MKKINFYLHQDMKYILLCLWAQMEFQWQCKHSGCRSYFTSFLHPTWGQVIRINHKNLKISIFFSMYILAYILKTFQKLLQLSRQFFFNIFFYYWIINLDFDFIKYILFWRTLSFSKNKNLLFKNIYFKIFSSYFLSSSLSYQRRVYEKYMF